MDDIRTLFQKLYHSKPNLQTNHLLQVLALKADKLSGVVGNTTSLFNGLVPEMRQLMSSTAQQRIPQASADETPNDIGIRDFRIRRLRLSGVRGIPVPKKDGLHFGFDLVSENDQCRSAVLVGANGAGKSSVFSALESLYVGELSEPALRYNIADQSVWDKYLSNADNPSLRHIDIEIADPTRKHFSHAVGDRIFELPQFQSLINPDSSFVAEADIFKLSRFSLNGDIDRHLQKNGIPLQSEIANLLGLASYLEVSKLLQAIQGGSKSRRAEKTNIKKLETNIRDTEDEIKQTQTDIQEKQRQLANAAKPRLPDEQGGLQRIEAELRKTPGPTMFDPSEIFKIADELSAAIKEREAMTTSASTKETVEFLRLGLELLAHANDCPMCLSSNKTRTEIEESARTRLSQFQRLVSLSEEIKRFDASLGTAIEDLDSAISQRLRQLETEEKLTAGLPEFQQNSVNAAKLISELSTLKSQLEQGLSEPQRNISGRTDEFFRKTVAPLESSIKSVFKNWELERQIFNEAKDAFTARISASSNVEIDPEQRFKLEIEQLGVRLGSLKKKLAADSSSLESAQADSRALESIADGIIEIVEEFNLDFTAQFESRFSPLQETILTITKSLFTSKERPQQELTFDFRDTIVDDIGSVQKTLELSVKTAAGNDVSPKYYLNAYRWKRLYSALSIAVAMAMRAKSKINLPLVIDDEILGADSSNRSEAVTFFERLLVEFRKRTPNMPLQLIVLTQDEFLFDCIREGIGKASDEIVRINAEDEGKGIAFHVSWRTPFADQTLFGRLFRPSDLEEEPRQGILSDDRYWCLVGEFPSRVISLQKTIKKAVGL